MLGKGSGLTNAQKGAAHISVRKAGTRNEVRPSGPRLNEGFSAASASSCFAGMSRRLGVAAAEQEHAARALWAMKQQQEQEKTRNGTAVEPNHLILYRAAKLGTRGRGLTGQQWTFYARFLY